MSQSKRPSLKDDDIWLPLRCQSHYHSTSTESASTYCSEKSPARQETKISWKVLFHFTRWSHASTLIGALFAAAVVAGFKSVLSIVIGKIFQLIGEFGTGTRSSADILSGISRWSIILVSLGVGNSIANSGFLMLWMMFGELQASSIRHEMFSDLLDKEMAWFDSQDEGVASLLVRIQTQTRELQLATSQVFGFLVSDGMTAIASLGVAFHYSWKLTLLILATIPPSIIILSLATRKVEPAIRAQRRDLAIASKHATSSLVAINLVKVFGGYDQELAHYSRSVKSASNQYLIQAACNSIQMGYVAFWLILTFVIGFWYGIVLVDDGLSPGSVMTTFYATLNAFQGAEAIIPHWLVFSKGISSGGFLKSVLSDKHSGSLARKMNRTRRPQLCDGDVELTNVSFAYPSHPDRQVLKKSSFFFPAGDITFIVGRSGSGKSTVGNLLSNFYEPTTGDIIIDGKSMRVLDENWIHENIALIQQSSLLFNDSFMNNIAIGHPDPESVTAEDVIAACEDVCLQTILAELPDGLDTNVGPDGHVLSGGQKQRLALARARLRNPTILILDEVTSGLDQVNRSLVMESLRRWRQNKTTIIITHDISQIDRDDYIYVMDDAIIVQEGFKRQLLQQQGGHFNSLARQSCPNEQQPTLQVNITSSTPQDLSPLPPRVYTQSSRMSDLFVRGLDEHALRLSVPGAPPRVSFGAATSHATTSRSEFDRYRANVDHRHSTAFIEFSNDPEEDRKRFSRYLTDRFELSSGKQLFDSPRTPTLSRSNAYPNHPKRTSKFHRQSVFSGLLSIPGSPPPQYEETFQGVDERATHSSTELLSLADSLTQYSSMPSTSAEILNSDELGIPQKLTKDPVKRQDSLITTLRTVWPNLTFVDKITMVFGVFLAAVGAAATPAFSYCFAQLLGVMTSPGNKSQRGMKWALLILAVAIIDGLGYGSGRYLMERVAQSWVNKIRTEALRKILLQPRPWYNKANHSPSRISECLDRNSEEMRNIVGKFIPIMVGVFTMVAISVLWAFAVSWKLTLVALAPIPVIMGAVQGFSFINGRWETKCNAAAEDTSALLTEVLLNVRVVRALTLGNYFGKRYNELVAGTLVTGIKRAAFSSPLFGLYQSTGYFLTALVFYYGAVMLSENRKFSVAEVMQVVNLLLFGMGTATSILSSIPQLTMAQATASQMLQYANLPVNPPEGHSGTQKAPSPTPIKFNNLHFMYSRHASGQVLRGVSFEIQSEKCTAIVGRSGCGKTTILSLLLGLNAPSSTPSEWCSSPPLEFGGIPFSDTDLAHFRSMTGYVSQFPFLFPGTITGNIVYGLPRYSPHRQPQNVHQAAQAAGIHEWIMSLPDGYHTLIGDGGQTVSGGQAQRLSIARALVRHPRLLVLDEPTSALDPENAELVRSSIQRLKGKRGMAIVIVTHDKQMMAVADRVVMLGQGGVVLEEGRFDELWVRRGAFWRLAEGIGNNEHTG